MARRNYRSSSYDRDHDGIRDDAQYPRRGKSDREAKVERITWALLVLVFAVLSLLPEDQEIPNWIVPAAGAVILIGSGFYQYSRRWRVGPMTWVGGAVMALLAFYSYEVDPNSNFLGVALIVFALVIIVGVITNET